MAYYDLISENDELWCSGGFNPRPHMGGDSMTNIRLTIKEFLFLICEPYELKWHLEGVRTLKSLIINECEYLAFLV